MRYCVCVAVAFLAGCSGKKEEPQEKPAEAKALPQEKPKEEPPSDPPEPRLKVIIDQWLKDSAKAEEPVASLELDDLIAQHRKYRGKVVEVTSWGCFSGYGVSLPNRNGELANLVFTDADAKKYMKSIDGDYKKTPYFIFRCTVDIPNADGVLRLTDGRFVKRLR